MKFYFHLKNKVDYQGKKVVWKLSKVFWKIVILLDVSYSEVSFTWEKGNLPETNIRERLDRGIANEEWLKMFLQYCLKHLPHSISDHCPILIQNESIKWKRDKMRRFEIWWAMEQSFENELKSLWDSSNGHIIEKLE